MFARIFVGFAFLSVVFLFSFFSSFFSCVPLAAELNQIHVSSATRALLAHDYRMVERKVWVKGKGSMATYFVGERFTKILANKRIDLVEKETDADDILEEVSVM